jgi:DNA-binding CsgD family transcriptional regulator
VSTSLPQLAAVLDAFPHSDALEILGRLLDSLPVAVLLTDCSSELRCTYANAVWRSWVPEDRLPIEDQPLGATLVTAEENGLIDILRQVCAAGEPAHYRGYRYTGLVGAPATIPDDVTIWDWEAYRLAPKEGPRHLLAVFSDVSERAILAATLDDEAPQRAADLRESASGILRIFGIAATDAPDPAVRVLSRREQEVALLVAQGLPNLTIARRLFVSRATVAGHVTSILDKLGFSSRVQIAAWVVERRLRGEIEQLG